MMLLLRGELPSLNEYIKAERSNRYQAAKVKRDYTELVATECKIQGLQPIVEPINIHYYWYCKNKRKDKSNVAFAKKFIEDGLVVASVLKNDSWDYIVTMRDSFFIDKDNPRIVVYLWV